MIQTAPPEPVPIEYTFDNIPAYFRTRPQWVCWRYELKMNSKGESKWTKVPMQAKQIGVKADTTDPTTWASYDDAVAAYNNPLYDGIGYMIAKNEDLVAVDIDHVERVEFAMIAKDIIATIQSYTERSVSGQGYHIYALGKKPGIVCKVAPVEMYEKARYLTFTGVQHGEWTTVERRDAEIAAVYEKYLAKDSSKTAAVSSPDTALSPGMDDLTILTKALGAKNGAKVRALWEGDTNEYDSDESRGDLALISLFAFYTQDPEQLDRLFGLSALGKREKWTGREDYRHRTIQKALDGVTEVYTNGGVEAVEVTDLSILDEAGGSVLAFPESAIVGLGREFTDLYSAHFEAPRAFWYCSFLTFLGAWLSKKVVLDSGLDTAPRLYTALLGISGWTRKSSAMDKTEDFFTRVQDSQYGLMTPEALAQSGTVLVLHGSGSAEGIVKRVMKDQHRPMLMKFDELKSLIDKGRQDGSQLMPLLTNTFEKGRWSNDTLTYGVDLKDAAISILSACTMKTFESAFRGAEADIGFLNRLWLVPARLDKVIAIPSSLPGDDLITLVGKVGARIRSLISIGDRTTPATFAPDARAFWTAWYTDFRRRTSVSETAARIDSYGLRLCILLAACAETAAIPDQLIITKAVTEAVIEMLEWQLTVRAQYYPTIADNQTAAMEQKIRKVLARASGQWFRRKDVYNLANATKVGTPTFDKAVDGLVRNAEVELRTERHKFNKSESRWYRSIDSE